MRLLLKNVKLLSGETANILAENGFIVSIGNETVEADEVFDARGLTAAPGLIDMHVHLRDPGFTHKEDIETGGRAAVAGGVTTVCCMPNTVPVADNADVLRYIINTAERLGTVRVLPIAAVTRGQQGTDLTDFAALTAAGACAFSDDGLPVMSGDVMREAMQLAARVNRPIISHCEDFNFTAPRHAAEYGLSADIAIETDEEAMVARDIALSLETGAPIHIAHVSTKNSVALVRAGKALGAKVTCETCPHYMLLTSDALRQHGANAKMNPPLRSEIDRAAIIDGLCDGTIDVIVTDHAPHSPSEKASEQPPNGIIGLETLLAGALTALKYRMSLAQIIEKMTLNPARILGLEKAGLCSGCPADIVLLDPRERWEFDVDKSESKSKNTPFNGFSFVGRARYTIAGGKFVSVISD